MKKGGTLQEWQAVARAVLAHDYDQADNSTKESILIGLDGWPLDSLCRQAAHHLRNLPRKRKVDAKDGVTLDFLYDEGTSGGLDRVSADDQPSGGKPGAS